MRRTFLLILVFFSLSLLAEDKKVSHPLVKLHTNLGDVVLEIRPDWAPMAAENFLIHVKDGYYDGILFHRVIRGFMIQGGDPTGTGRGGDSIWHRPFKNEYAKNVVFDRPGMLAMANAGPDTNRSQFFITVAPAPWLNGGYTIFGRVVKGMDVVQRISRVPTGPGDRPLRPVRILEAEVVEP
ncbi:peptidylprolyl isomerase [Hydrogenimonas sp.]